MSSLEILRRFTFPSHTVSDRLEQSPLKPVIQRSASDPYPRLEQSGRKSMFRATGLRRLDSISNRIFPWLKPRTPIQRMDSVSSVHVQAETLDCVDAVSTNAMDRIEDLAQQVKHLLEGYDALKIKIDLLIQKHAQDAHSACSPSLNFKSKTGTLPPVLQYNSVSCEYMSKSKAILDHLKGLIRFKNTADVQDHMSAEFEKLLEAEAVLQTQLYESKDLMDTLYDKVYLSQNGFQPVTAQDELACKAFKIHSVKSDELAKALDQIHQFKLQNSSLLTPVPISPTLLQDTLFQDILQQTVFAEPEDTEISAPQDRQSFDSTLLPAHLFNYRQKPFDEQIADSKIIMGKITALLKSQPNKTGFNFVPSLSEQRSRLKQICISLKAQLLNARDIMDELSHKVYLTAEGFRPKSEDDVLSCEEFKFQIFRSDESQKGIAAIHRFMAQNSLDSI